ncbi:Hypothetical predicted protein [Marmota monax]|uniref:Uncharacterized protein n=1 Tax=Marmota monax TaxID=9995 RepID=A0A5E4CLP9_MARMO|nr:hypothetical protein GHT09_019171 [Marmota monax]VTJ82758.1 Hypothetical predicted protein [Marmota monax]
MEILEHLVHVGQRVKEDCQVSRAPQVTWAHQEPEFPAKQVLEVSLGYQELQGPQEMMELLEGMESQDCQVPRVTREAKESAATLVYLGREVKRAVRDPLGSLDHLDHL